MNRRRVVAAIAGICVLVLCALLIPSFHRSTAEPVGVQPAAANPAASVPVASDTSATNSPATVPPVAVVTEAASRPAPAPAPQAASGIADVDPHKAFGSKTAPVTVEIFSDFQCPACKQLYLATNQKLIDSYVNTGKVYLIHRDFPLPIHAHSRVAARYARAAAQIGKTEVVEQVLFENQEKWEQSGDVDGTIAAVLSPADMKKVRALVQGGTLDALIDKDYALGQGYRVNQTPTSVFHAKGQTYPYAGVMSYDVLKQFLDQLLK